MDKNTMRFTTALLILGLLGGASCASACEHQCPPGQSWQGSDQTGSCQPDPSNNTVGSNSTSTANSTSTSTSTSKSDSNSTAVATGGDSKSSSSATGGNSSSTIKDSGNSSIKDSGNSSSKSSVSDSGNSSNKNTNVATGGAGGAGGSASATGGSSNQTQTATAENNSSGNSTSFVSSYKEAAATAMGYAAPPSATCIVTGGLGGQGVGFGFSLSGGKTDKGCVILEASRSAALYGNRLLFCKVYLTHPAVKKAGVTLQDCLQQDPRPVEPQTWSEHVAAPAPVPIIVQIPAPIVNIPAPVVTVLPAPTPVVPISVPVIKPVQKHKTIIGLKPCPSPASFSTNDKNCYETE